MSDATQETLDYIQKQINEHPVVLYMKGSPTFPQCGFSAKAVSILKQLGLSPKNIFAVDVLADPAIRQGIKQFSNWPTVPQLYINSTFIGGSDIMMDMYENGELQVLIDPVIKSMA